MYIESEGSEEEHVWNKCKLYLLLHLWVLYVDCNAKKRNAIIREKTLGTTVLFEIVKTVSFGKSSKVSCYN